MLINFGNTETGSGQIEPPKATPPPVKATPPPPEPQAQVANSAKEDINTQDFEEAAAVEAAKKKEDERKIKEANEKELEVQKNLDIERLKTIERQEAIELERLRQEELDRIEKERQEQEAKAEAIRQQTSNAFGKTSNDSQGQGTTDGEGNQGSLDGSTTSNGNGLGSGGKWSLAGRSIKGSLPEPNYKLQKSGIVVVEISVDQTGKVTSATPGKKGSSTLDPELLKLAKEAALKAQFNANPTAQAKQIGTITYNFVLN